MDDKTRAAVACCDDVLSLLQAEQRLTGLIRQHLERGDLTPDLAVRDCERLLDVAVQIARCVADLRNELCPPAGPSKPDAAAQ